MAAAPSPAASPPTAPFAGRVLHPAAEGIVYGPGSMARELPALLDRCGVQRAFVVSTASVTRAGLVDRVRDLLGDRVVGVFDASQEHTPEPVVQAAAAMARASDADGIISLGGSSVVDLAKGVALILAEGEDLAALRSRFRAGQPGSRHRPRLDAPKLVHIAITTTLSGAEFTGGVGITDPVARNKNLYWDAKLTPRWVVLDAELTKETPPALWAATGMKALADTLEVLCSTRATPLSDAVAAGGLSLLLHQLGPATAAPHDLDARGRCQFAVGMVLPQLAAVGVGLVAGLRHQLGGALGVPHGIASTIVLPHVVRWNASACAAALHRAATGAGYADAEALIVAVEALTVQLELPTRLRDVGVVPDDLAAVAEHTLGDGAVATNPRPVNDAAGVLEVLNAAW